jgi:predicted acyl esterase
MRPRISRFLAVLLLAVSASEAETPAPQPLYPDVLCEHDVMVAMRDGVLLATDIYRPGTGAVPAPERLPVLLHRTPYDKSEAATVSIARLWRSTGTS